MHFLIKVNTENNSILTHNIIESSVIVGYIRHCIIHTVSFVF